MPDNYDELGLLRAEAILGKECHTFFNSDPGRYVKARANEVIIKSLEKLKEIRSDDKDAVTKLQVEVKSADNALTWLQEAINDGERAMQQLHIMSEQD